MNEKELYQQKVRAQLDEWMAELEKLRAKASGASADAKQDLNEHIKVLESKIEEGETMLAEISEATDSAWETVKEGAESAFETLTIAVREAADKFKK